MFGRLWRHTLLSQHWVGKGGESYYDFRLIWSKQQVPSQPGLPRERKFGQRAVIGLHQVLLVNRWKNIITTTNGITFVLDWM